MKESNKDQIEVTAHTSDGKGKDVHDCIVWYVNVLADEEKDKLRFDRFSTPTTHSMPGGKYHIWTEKNGKYGRKDPFSCGDDGKSKREIDLLAPEN